MMSPLITLFWTLLSLAGLVGAIDALTYCAPVVHEIDPTLKFLNKSDGYDVTWARMVNSAAKLNQALSGEKMIMIGDVSLQNNEPYMKHASQNAQSNLTLATFLEQAVASNKGIKLNFHDPSTVLPALQIIQNVTSGQDNPIWLHAGVLPLPSCTQGCSQPLSAPTFINLCKQYAPNAVISLGWASGNDVASNTQGYSWQEVLQMGKLIYDINQPGNVQVHANLIKIPAHVETREAPIDWLMDLVQNNTIIITMGENETLHTAEDLADLRKIHFLEKARIYYDLSIAQWSTFQAAEKRKTYGFSFDKNPWKVYFVSDCKDVLVGKEFIMFSGAGGWVSTVEELTAKGLESRHATIEVSFLDLGASNPQQNFTIFVGSDGLSGNEATVGPNTGLRFTLWSNGEFSVIGAGGSEPVNSTKNITDPNRNYTVSFWYHPKLSTVSFTVRSRSNFMSSEDKTFKGLEFSKYHVVMGSEDMGGGGVMTKLTSAIALPGGAGGSEQCKAGGAIYLFMLLLLLAWLG